MIVQFIDASIATTVYDKTEFCRADFRGLGIWRHQIPTVVAFPVDYGENLRLTEKLGAWACP
jgi:hypothetical protein